MIKRDLPNTFLILWSLAGLGATCAHLFFTQRVAEASVWGTAPGWQREIGFFDLMLAGTAIYAVLRNDRTLKRYLCLMLPSLCILLGANHFAAYLQSGHLLHLQWSALNILAVICGYLSFRFTGASLR